MHKWIFRTAFFVLLLASIEPDIILHARAERAERSADIETTVRYLLTHEGMTYRGTRIFSGGALKSIIFDVPSCNEPVQVVPTPRTFDASALFDRVGAPNDVRLFVYLSRVSEQESRFSFFLEHLKHNALGLIALTPYQPDGMMLLISEPQSCKTLPPIYWPLVWQTDYRIKVARKEPTQQLSGAASR